MTHIRSLIATMQVLAVARGDHVTDHGSVYDTLLTQDHAGSVDSRGCRINPAAGRVSRLPHGRAAILMRGRGQYI